MAQVSNMTEGKYQLFDYQEVSVEELLKHPRYALFHEVGCGKTVTVVAAINRLPEGSVLVLAPKRVIDGVWLKMDPPIKHKKVLYLNYEKLSRLDSHQLPKYDYLILDECQKIKASNTKLAKYIRTMSTHAKRIYALTGTPVGNSFVDVFNIFKNMGVPEFQYPEAAFIAKYYNTFSIPVQTKYGMKQIPQIASFREQFRDELFERFGRYSNSVKMDDVHDLPEQHTFVHKIKGMRTEEYELAEEGIIKLSEEDVSVVAKLEAVNKCHQAANGFMYYIDLNTDLKHVKRFDHPNMKIEKLREIVTQCSGENLIIVYQFTADKLLLKRELKAMGRHPVDDFLDIEDGDVLLMQIGSGAGVNIQHWCHTMIFYSFNYSHLDYTQTSGRIYRIGQKFEVNYHILIAEGTVEEKIYKAIVNKHSMDEYLKEVTKLDVYGG